jgi:hypothetical protein
MLQLLKRLFCAHAFVFRRNIYGDEIIHRGYKRSISDCSKCGRRKYHEYLNGNDSPSNA